MNDRHSEYFAVLENKTFCY